MGRVADAARELIGATAGRRARNDATVHVERDRTDRARRHHVQQSLVLAHPSARRLVFGQPQPAPMLPPTCGCVEVRRVDEREAAEVLRGSSGEEGVTCAGRGEVERPCELRGVARPCEEGQ